MPSISEIIGRAIATPIEKQAAKTTAELMAESAAREIPQHHIGGADIPISPARKPFVLATAAPEKKTVWDWLDTLKTSVGSFFTAEANAPVKIKDWFHAARRKADDAQMAADEVLATRVVAPLTGNVLNKSELVSKAKLLSAYVTQLSDYADLQAKYAVNPDGHFTGLGGATIDQVEADLFRTAALVKKNPDVVLAHKGFRNVMDEVFDVMKQHGYITDTQYRQEYTPVQKLQVAIRGLSSLRGDEAAGGETLSAMLHRNTVGELRETNVIKTARRTIAELYEKIAEDELVTKVLADPALNRTAEFTSGQLLPKGWARYTPRPGMPGWVVTDPTAEGALGLIDGLEPNLSKWTPGSFVIPEDLARRLEHFRKPKPRPGLERNLFQTGRAWAKWLTVGNPANTGLNVVSDYVTGMLGMPGEKSLLPGYLAFTPKSYIAALRGAFGKESPLYARAQREGLTSATLVESVSGERVPESLVEAIGEPVKKQGPYMEFMERLRRGLETAPRIAGGLAAEARSKNAADFGRVGQALTLDYGAGSPAYSRHPLISFLAPFLKFMGLATERTAKLLTTPGSRGRAWAAVAGVPTAAMLWNHQNAEFEKVEYSLPDYDRYAMHIIVGDENGHPTLDRNGKPIVLKFRYFIPEEVANFFGVGNMPSRLLEAAQGRIGPGEMVSGIVGSAAENIVGQLVPAQVAMQVGTGRSILTGQKTPRADLIMDAVPVVKQSREVVRAGINAGPAEAAKTAAEQFGGVRFASVAKKGRADADLLEIKVELNDWKQRRRSALARGDHAKADDAARQIDRLLIRVRAITAARRKARTGE